MSATFKGSCTSGGGVACNANTAVTWSGGPPASTDSIVVFVYCTTAVNDFTGVTDSAGNTYTQDHNYVDGASAGHAVYRASNISGSPTWIRIGKTSTSNICFVASAYAGLTTGAIESVSSYTEGAGTVSHSIPYTTANSNDLVLMLYHGSTDIPTPTNLGSWGWIDGNRNSTDAFYLLDAGAAGSYNFTFTGPFFTANMVRAVYQSAVTDPTVTSVTSTATPEGTATVHTVTLSGPTNRDTAYAYAWSGGATGADYTQALTTGMCARTGGASGNVTVSGSNITAETGVSAFTITVPTAQDALDEDNETIVLTVGGVASTGGSITDDDALPSISITPSITVDGGDSVVLTCTLGAVSGRVTQARLVLTDGTKVGGVDYTNVITDGMFTTVSGSGTVTISAGVLSIPAGVVSFTITIPTTP